jgi:hypothetical protein
MLLSTQPLWRRLQPLIMSVKKKGIERFRYLSNIHQLPSKFLDQVQEESLEDLKIMSREITNKLFSFLLLNP